MSTTLNHDFRELSLPITPIVALCILERYRCRSRITIFARMVDEIIEYFIKEGRLSRWTCSPLSTIHPGVSSRTVRMTSCLKLMPL